MEDELMHPLVQDYLDEDEEDIDQNEDPASLEEIDWDKNRDNEEGDTPNENVGISPEDFKPVSSPLDILAQVRKLVEERLKKPLGGPLVASQLKGYCTVTVEELQAIEDKEKGLQK